MDGGDGCAGCTRRFCRNGVGILDRPVYGLHNSAQTTFSSTDRSRFSSAGLFVLLT